MNINLKKSIRRIFRSFGYDVQRYTTEINSNLQLINALTHHEIKLIFDIGANKGQFGYDLRGGGYKGEIVSFEPLPQEYMQLKEASSHDILWTVYSRCAIGDQDGETNIFISGNSVSSSILPMMETHRMVAKDSGYVGSVRADIFRLDSISREFIAPEKKYFIKIDTQGYEWNVLDGATQTLDGASGVLCELSLVALYDGQRLWNDLMDRLTKNGFNLWSVQPGFSNYELGRTLQLDAVFFRG